MAYTVLARRYRSRTFDELIGQEAIADTLRAAIKLKRVAHAYLFTGTRGVGKTSSARIFANELNNPGDDAAIRDAIMRGQDTDVIEIDAASNSKVEEARELIANAVYRPMRGRYKVYIIDECHMLSTAAFNALLKTMEEPPEHVVFILCTTETHKVPATIQSRCQRYDFRTIPVARIAAHLKAVLKDEQRAADDELLHMVARLANGSMRDALSLMDRLLASGDQKMTTQVLEDLLGLPERDEITRLVDALADGDAGSALTQAGALLSKGVGVEPLLTSVAERLRDLLVISACGPQTDLIELAGESRNEAAAQAARFDAAGLTHMIALCDAVARSARQSTFPRAVVDALITRLALTEKIADVTAIVAGGGGGGARANGASRAGPAEIAGKKR